MNELRYTLIAEGSSDEAFLPILNWLLIDLGVSCGINGKWADFRNISQPSKSLTEKISLAPELYPCDLLFIHRDSDNQFRQKRVEEIEKAIKKSNIERMPIVCVIPIRMLEAWLLFDEIAIRKAAGNPQGKSNLNLPLLKKLESLDKPKKDLQEALKKASEFKGRKLKKFNEGRAIQRLAKIIRDFSPLYQLSAFQALKKDLSETLHNQGWL